jgi:hypothetical protein
MRYAFLDAVRVGIILVASVLCSACVSNITALPGPVYFDASGNPMAAVAVAGKNAGGPCIEAPVCLLVVNQ